MNAKVALDFTPPDEPNIVKLVIYEAPLSTGPWVAIDETTDIGVFPEYISRYSTVVATNTDDWFAIAWVDDKDVELERSLPLKGGVHLFIGEIVERVMQRERGFDKGVVAQEVESVIQRYFGDGTDPYSPSLTASYRVKNGLTYLVLARMFLLQLVANAQAQSATIGLVSFRAESAQMTKANIDGLIELANEELGLFTSVVLEMAMPTTTYGLPTGLTWLQVYQQIPYVIVP